jgi:hypothetical protein
MCINCLTTPTVGLSISRYFLFVYILVYKQKAGRLASVEGSRYTVKKVSGFPSPVGMSLTKLFLASNNKIIPAQGEFGE